jgi:hypothetical protein
VKTETQFSHFQSCCLACFDYVTIHEIVLFVSDTIKGTKVAESIADAFDDPVCLHFCPDYIFFFLSDAWSDLSDSSDYIIDKFVFIILV